MLKRICVWAVSVLILAVGGGSWALQDADTAPVPSPSSESRDRMLRDRYEEALRRNPFQDQAFDRVYESYLTLDGLEAWVERIEARLDESEDRTADLVLLGRIRARQFKTAEAVQALEEARGRGADSPDFHLLLGTLYHDTGRNAEAADLLGSALETVTDAEKRARICRILGNVYLRQGDRDAAVAAWKRLSERDPDDVYAVLELADVYRDHRMWAEAVEALERLVALSPDNAYRRCWAWRAVGDCHLRMERHAEAIAAYERGLALAAPGNWLFEDIKQRLVNVYQDLGDLEGLAAYAGERIAADPADLEFRGLLAETYARMGRRDEAETQYHEVLERAPDRVDAYENLIALYRSWDRPEKVREVLEKLIELVPADPDYVRRLGEAYLEAGLPDEAKAAWQRVAGPESRAEAWALLADWFERYDFLDDALAAYETARTQAPSREWTFRVAALRHEKGEEDEAVGLWLSTVDEASSAADHAEVAGLLQAHGRAAEAEPLLRKAMALEPANPEHAATLARLLMQQKRFEEAVPLFAALSEQDANAYLRDRGEQGLIEAYTALEVLAEKQRDWEAEVEAKPEAVAPRLRLARLYRHGGNHAGAVEQYRRCAELEPENYEHLRRLAEAYQANRQMAEAMDTLARLAEVDKTRAGGYLRELLRLYVRGGLQEKAVATAQRVVELAPGDAEARIDLAQTYMLYGEPDAALAEYRQALRLAPEEPDFHRQYGEALAVTGRMGEAQESYRRMLETAREDATRLDAVNRLGQVYAQQGRLDELVQEFQGRLRHTPKRLAAYQELAALHKVAANPAKALEVLDEAANASDDKAQALRLILNETYTLGEYERAAVTLQQLMALSGQTTIQELERLGSIYHQLGDLDRARAAWKRITDEYGQSAEAHRIVSSALFDAGLADEAFEAKVRALELDPYDYKLRFEYAQQLAAFDRIDEALAELQRILELGDAPPLPETAETAREKKVKPLQGSPSSPRAYPGFLTGYPMGGMGGFYPAPGFYPGRFGAGRGMYRGSLQWSGSFADFRPALIATMVEMARRLQDDEVVVDYFRKRAEDNPGNFEAQFDLLTVYTAANRWDDALAQAETLLAARPDDIELLGQVATYYMNRDKPEQALEKYELLLTRLEEGQKRPVVSQIIHLKARLNRHDEALALAQSMLEENADDPGAVFQVAGALQMAGKADEALALLKDAQEKHPKHRDQFRNMLANLAQQQGRIDEAWAIQEETLFAADTGDTTAQYGRPPLQIHTPNFGGMRSGRFGNDFASLARAFMPSLPYPRLEALSQLLRFSMASDERLEGLMCRMEEGADLGKAGSDADRVQAAMLAKMLVAYQAYRGGHEAALARLESLEQDLGRDPELMNMKLYLLDALERFDDMLPLYEALETVYPAQSRAVAQARLNLAMLRQDYDSVAAHVRELLRQPAGPNEAMNVIQNLRQAGQKDLARQLLAEVAATGRRRDPALADMLARFHAEDGDYEAAIALARESFDRQPQGATPGMYSFHPQYSPRTASVGNLARYYQQANRLPELIREFEERLEKQPGSVQFHEDLAALYRTNNEPARAIALYRKLLEARPNNSRVRMALAELHQQAGEPRKALEIYEAMLRTQPSMYQQVSHQIRQLYQQLGKTQELVSLEDEMIRRNTNPDVLRSLAWEARGRNDFNRAIELMEKLIAADPSQAHYQQELSQLYEQAGRHEDALKALRQQFDAARGNAAWYDPQLLRRMAGLYERLGRLDELVAEADTAAEEASPPVWALGLRVQIARHQGRLDDATSLLEDMTPRLGPNPYQALMELAEIAEQQGDLDKAIRILEDLAQRSGGHDFARVARLYLQKGDTEKAMEYWDKQAAMQGAYAYVDGMRQLIQAGLWDQAAPYYERCRKATVREPQTMRQIDEQVLQAFTEEGQLLDLVEKHVLASDSPHVADMARRLFWNDVLDFKDVRRLVEPILQRFPENLELAGQYASLLQRNDLREEALAIYARLVDQQPDNAQYRRQYVQALVEADRRQEAIDLLTPWVEANPAPERVQVLVGVLQQSGSSEEVLGLRTRLLEKASPEQQDALRVLFATFQANAGDVEEARQVLKEAFDKDPSMASFSRYFTFLVSRGLNTPAYEFVKEHMDAEFFDWRQLEWQGFLRVCRSRGDLELVDEAMWKRWQARGQTDTGFALRELFGHHFGQEGALQLLERFETRLREEHGDDDAILNALAQAYHEGQRPEKALKLYDECLERNPRQPGTVRAKLSLLRQLGRHQECLEWLEALVKESTPQAEPDLFLTLARTHMEAKREAEADAVLASFDAGLTERHAYEIGSIHMIAGRYEKALDLFEQAQKSGPGMALRELITCYVKTGRLDDARKLWDRLRREHEVAGMAQALVEAGLHQEAREFIEPRLSRFRQDQRMVTAYGKALAALGDHEGHRRFFMERYDSFSRDRREQLLYGYAQFLAENRLLSESIASDAFLTHAGLQDAVLRGTQYLGGEDRESRPDLARQAADRLKDVTLPPQVALSLANVLSQVEEKSAAIDLLYQAGTAPDASAAQRMQALQQLAHHDPARALPICEAVVADHPRALVENEEVLRVLAASPETDRAEAVLAHLPEVCLNESERIYALALFAYHAGRKEEAAQALKDLTGTAALPPHQLQRALMILAEGNETAAALELVDQLLGADGSSNPPWSHQAALMGIDLALAAADGGRAMRYLTQVPALTEGDAFNRARQNLDRGTRVEHLDAMKAALQEAVQAAPEDDRVSDWVGLYAQLAARFDRQESAGDLAQALGACDREVAQARLWDRAIEDWMVSAFYPLPEQQRTMQEGLSPELARVAQGAAPLSASGLEWKRSDPKHALGLVNVGDLIEVPPVSMPPGYRYPQALQPAMLPAQCAVYAVTVLVSPDDREVEFAHGSDDWVTIWVNGDVVHGNYVGRSAAIDQDRFRAPLKAGRNVVLMRVGNSHGDWLFGLAPIEGGDGLQVERPE